MCIVVAAFCLLAGCAGPSRVPLHRNRSGRTAVPSMWMLSASPYPVLQKKIDRLLPDSLFPPANIGIKIVSLTRGETLYELNPTMLFHPASNEKLFTSAAALNWLRPDFLFATRFSIDTLSSPGTLFVKGFGDPLLSTSDIDSIAWYLRRALPPGRSWGIIGDTSYFDNLQWGSGWTWDDEPDPDAMFISPLSVNRNTMTLHIRPGQWQNAPLIVTPDPPTQYASLEIKAHTVVDTVLEDLSVSRSKAAPCVQPNLITIKGELLRSDTTVDISVSLAQPEFYTLTLLLERLQALGVQAFLAGMDTVPSTALPLTQFTHRLDTVLTFMNKESDNLAAECVLKTLGVRNAGPPGTAENGIALVRRFLGNRGIDTTMVVLVDGSGVSRYNLMSAAIVVDLLAAMYADKELFPPYVKSLPIAGIDGTLKRRMRNTSAQGNLRAKTGTLSGTSSLSGYLRTADGELLAFSILMQHFPDNTRAYRNVQDGIGILLSGLTRREME